ncbi:MAG: succinylglutamate desuccinylase/aspartoacylase family protein [Planctomycetes bacterium]|nr:succinylglutamate desuccinylase/aspartoacylase family protein [Planctomycetota bacterium]
MSRSWNHRATASVALLAPLALSLAACGSTEIEPGGPPPERRPGSRLAEHLAEFGPAPAPRRSERTTALPPRPVVFRSDFDHAITVEPIVHPERSVAGRPLRYWVFGDGAEVVLVLGGMHGDERSSTEAAYDLLEWACDHPTELGGRKLVVAPDVNPDGNVDLTRRNARSVDLNRNFPAQNWLIEDGGHGPGPYPASEPETRFVLALLNIYAPTRVIATHAAAACVNFDGPGEALAEAMSRACGLPTASTIGYPTPGSLGSYLGADRGVPTITFELATKDRVGPAGDATLAALLAALHFPHPVPIGAAIAPPR